MLFQRFHDRLMRWIFRRRIADIDLSRLRDRLRERGKSEGERHSDDRCGTESRRIHDVVSESGAEQ
jgi:hypothetical protein